MISNSFANDLLGLATGRITEWQFPDYVYLGICANEPSHSTGAVSGEPTGKKKYARKKVGGAAADAEWFFGSASGGIISNSKEIQMPTAREAWGMMNYWFLSNTSSGNAILWGEIYDKNGNIGLQIDAETVPVFYEYELRASIGVELEPPEPDAE